MIDWIRSWFHMPNISDAPSYVEAYRWYKSLNDGVEKCDEIILSHARMKHEESSSIVDGMDSKFDNLIRLSAVLIGATFAVVKAAEVPFGGWHVFACVLLLVCIVICLLSRMSYDGHSLITTRQLIEFKKDNPEYDVSIVLAGSLHANQQSLKLVAEWKGTQYNRAAWILVLALASLVIGMS